MPRVPDELSSGTPKKQLRFRGDSGHQNRLEDLFDDSNKGSTTVGGNKHQNNEKDNRDEREAPSFRDFFRVEMTRGYMLEHDEERYTARRQKIYSFMKIPRDLERFMVYGIMQCADSFLYIHTFLPIRYSMALWALISRPIARCLGLRRRTQRLLAPAEICDILKGSIWIAVTLVMLSVDTNRVYHIIKSQSIIKLYIFYNILEVGDRLLSAFGQDAIDALFWTATEPKNSKREHLGLLTHIIFALTYVLVHSFLIMLQATTLNVAINSNNKGLLTIMMSNNFVELKGSVFKKFDKNNLFQLACSDVRERFHLSVLLFIVVIQTMKEFSWSFTHFCVMLPDCFYVLITEIMIDWIKHAFITRFNELPECIYREYTTSLAYDMTQTRQKHAFSDHSDLVARRMGFIPLPLGVVLIKAVYSAVSFDNVAAFILFVLAYGFVMGLRIWITILALGKACKLMKEHQDEKNNSTPSSMTNPPRDVATSPVHSLQRSFTVDLTNGTGVSAVSSTPKHTQSSSSSADVSSAPSNTDIELDMKSSLELGATALFWNSDVDLDDVRLNEKVLETSAAATGYVEEELAHSEPDLLQQQQRVHGSQMQHKSEHSSANSGQMDDSPRRSVKRTHRRSESEPSMPAITAICSQEGEAQT